ncbi:MAG TPA: hypothetical protein VML75_24395 [Kofleriaceae bacterium]|nr:hypothetical protein [Kofleriaceae bacterium]
MRVVGVLLVLVAAAGCVREGRDSPPPQYRLEVASTPGGTISSEPPGISCGTVCSARFVRGAVVTLVARPYPGVELAAWGGPCRGRSICTVAVRGETRVQARFVMAGSGEPVPADLRPVQDLDGDGVVDELDRCPVEAPAEGHGPDGDGCP